MNVTRISYDQAVEVLRLLEASDDRAYVYVTIDERNPQCLNYGQAWTAAECLLAINASNTLARDLGHTVTYTVHRKEV